MSIGCKSPLSASSLAQTELIRKAQAGNRAAFSQLVKNHYGFIFSTAYRSLGNRSDAEDVAQVVCMRLATAIQSFDWRSLFLSWLYRITLNAARDLKRSQARQSRLSSEIRHRGMGAARADQEDGLAVEDVWQTINSLPENQREAMALVYGKHLSHDDAALVMGCKKTTVAWHIHKARQNLRCSLSS